MAVPGIQTLEEGPATQVVETQIASGEYVWHPVETLPAPGQGDDLLKRPGLLLIGWQQMGGWFLLGVIENGLLSDPQAAVEFVVAIEPRLSDVPVYVTEVGADAGARFVCQRYAPTPPPVVEVIVTPVS